MGKYTDMVTKFALRPEDPVFQEKVNQAKDRMSADHLTIIDVGKKLIECRKHRDTLKAQVKAATVEVTAYEQLLCDSNEANHGQTVWGLDSGETLSIEIQPYPHIQNREVFRQWCLHNGLGNSLSLPPQSVMSLVKERLEAALPELPGIETYYKKTVVLRKRGR